MYKDVRIFHSLVNANIIGDSVFGFSHFPERSNFPQMRQKLIRVRELSVGRERFVKLMFLIIRETNSRNSSPSRRLQCEAHGGLERYFRPRWFPRSVTSFWCRAQDTDA
jgi:hypothetical protein